MDRFTRRGSLLKAGGLLAGLAAAGGWRVADSEGAGPAAVEAGAVACVLAPEQTEGPYYIPKEKIRRNITEGRPGRPLTLRLQVVNASTCKPIAGAAVDVWHADAGRRLLGLRAGRREPHLHARDPADETRRASQPSGPSTRAGTRAAPCTST